MDKKKFDMQAEAPVVNTYKGIGVVSYIPYEEKESFIMELLSITMQLDDE